MCRSRPLYRQEGRAQSSHLLRVIYRNEVDLMGLGKGGPIQTPAVDIHCIGSLVPINVKPIWRKKSKSQKEYYKRVVGGGCPASEAIRQAPVRPPRFPATAMELADRKSLNRYRNCNKSTCSALSMPRSLHPLGAGRRLDGLAARDAYQASWTIRLARVCALTAV